MSKLKIRFSSTQSYLLLKRDCLSFLSAVCLQNIVVEIALQNWGSKECLQTAVDEKIRFKKERNFKPEKEIIGFA